MEHFYYRLRELRIDHDMAQWEVAQYLGTTRQQYGRYENGERDLPANIVIRLAYLYQTSADYILGMTDNPKPCNDILR